MRPFRRGTITCALAGAWLLAAGLAWSQESAPSPEAEAKARAELERRGATIRAVNITTNNIFDTSNPKEDKRLYHLANRLHIRTRSSVIDNVLLFHEGETFQARLIDESARALRALKFLSDATIVPRGYDEATNTVEIDVEVRDSWTLSTDMKFSHTGGASEWTVGLEDRNVLGRGKELKVNYRSSIDRDETYLGYIDPNLLGSRVRLAGVYTDASDGYRHQIDVDRPFYELDARWSLGGSVHDELRIDKLYDLGEEIDRFEHGLKTSSLHFGWSRGLIDGSARRWLVGVTSDENRFAPTLDVAQTELLPDGRKLVYPWIGWQRVEDDFREMRQLNDMGRTEDISLGLNLLFKLGFARRSFGSDRDAEVFEASAQAGWEPGGPGRLLLLDVGGSTRNETDGPHSSKVAVGARYYRRNLEKHLFSVSLNALLGNNLDADEQVLLGGDNGLRGYPLRYQAGEQRVILAAEQRFFTDWYPARLFRVGYAVFADAGRVRGRDPRATPSLGTLYDVGVGLRLTSPRASGRSVVHIDLAFPLNGDPTIDSSQLVVETKGSF
jgi:hypothetical protein